MGPRSWVVAIAWMHVIVRLLLRAALNNLDNRCISATRRGAGPEFSGELGGCVIETWLIDVKSIYVSGANGGAVSRMVPGLELNRAESPA